MEKVLIGKVTSAVGIRGEVRVYNYSDSDAIYRETPQLYVGDTLREVEHVRMQKNMVVLKLSGIEDRNDAERLRGCELFVTEQDLPELEEGVYYVRDLIGMEVVTEEGELLGTVRDVIQNTAQDLFELRRRDGRLALIPKVDRYIAGIDGEARRVTVRDVEELLEL